MFCAWRTFHTRARRVIFARTATVLALIGLISAVAEPAIAACNGSPFNSNVSLSASPGTTCSTSSGASITCATLSASISAAVSSVGFSWSGGGASAFSVAACAPGTGGYQNGPEPPCVTPVTFHPTAAGTYTATLKVSGTVPTNGCTFYGTITFTGTAAANPPTLALTAAPTTCGPSTVGTPVNCTAVTLTAQNGSITLGSNPFSQSDSSGSFTIPAGTCTSGAVLPSGSSCTTGAIVFNPNQAKTYADTVTVNSTSATATSFTMTATGYTYSWTTSGWTPSVQTACSSSFLQTRTVSCRRNDGVTVDNSFCTSGSMPTDNQTIEAFGGCTYSWQLGDFGACVGGYGSWSYTNWTPTCGVGLTTQTRSGSCTVTTGSGIQTETVSCLRSDGVLVDTSNCPSPQPSVSQPCTPAAGFSCGPEAVLSQQTVLAARCPGAGCTPDPTNGVFCLITPF